MRKTLVAVLAVVVCGGLAASAYALTVPSGAAVLNTREAANDGAAGPVSHDTVLQTGAFYVLTVSGTYSAWGAWPNRRCGKPEPSAVYPANANPDIAVGDDVEFRFAQPNFARADCPSNTLPKKLVVFQTNIGDGWKHRVPLTGAPTKPKNNAHAYDYGVVGQGSKPRFRLVDHKTSDNFGKIAIEVRDAVKSDCNNGGFTSFGFADVATCKAAF